MPKGFTEDGRPILTKDEFVELWQYDKEMKEERVKKEVRQAINKKAIEDFNEDNRKQMKQLNKHTKQAATTTKSNKENSEILESIVEMLQSKTELSSVEIDKTTITVVQKADTYELKWQKKREAFEVEEYSGTKDAVKNKLITYICDIETKCTIQPIDKSGLIGVIDGDTYYTIKITKKRA